MNLVPRSTVKARGEHGISWESNTLLFLGYADDLSILDENGSKMNAFLEGIRDQGARIGLKIDVEETKLLRLGIIKGEEVMLDNKKID